MIEKLTSNTKKLFLIDGLGACLSAFLLGFVLVRFESVFGIPRNTLYFLASIPVLFAIYDFINYRRSAGKTAVFLKGIAILNLLYCLISIGAAFYHLDSITIFGWSYILVEILIVLTLATVEYRVATASASF